MIRFFEKFSKLSEMANLVPIDTGLPMAVYVSDKSGVPHGARLKVSKFYGGKIDKGNLFTITISDNPTVIGKNTGNIKLKDIELVKSFIVLNKDLLLQYWNFDIGIGEVLRKLRKL